MGWLHAASLSDALAFQLWPLSRGGAMLPWDDSKRSRVGAGTRTAGFHSRRDLKLDCLGTGTCTGTGSCSCSDIEGNLKLNFWLKLRVMPLGHAERASGLWRLAPLGAGVIARGRTREPTASG